MSSSPTTPPTRRNVIASLAILLTLAVILLVIAYTYLGNMIALKIGPSVSTSAVVVDIVEYEKTVRLVRRKYHMPIFGFMDTHGKPVIAKGLSDGTTDASSLKKGTRIPVRYLAADPQVVQSDRIYQGQMVLFVIFSIFSAFLLLSCIPILKKLKDAPA